MDGQILYVGLVNNETAASIRAQGIMVDTLDAFLKKEEQLRNWQEPNDDVIMDFTVALSNSRGKYFAIVIPNMKWGDTYAAAVPARYRQNCFIVEENGQAVKESDMPKYREIGISHFAGENSIAEALLKAYEK